MDISLSGSMYLGVTRQTNRHNKRHILQNRQNKRRISSSVRTLFPIKYCQVILKLYNYSWSYYYWLDVSYLIDDVLAAIEYILNVFGIVLVCTSIFILQSKVNSKICTKNSALFYKLVMWKLHSNHVDEKVFSFSLWFLWYCRRSLQESKRVLQSWFYVYLM